MASKKKENDPRPQRKPRAQKSSGTCSEAQQPYRVQKNTILKGVRRCSLAVKGFARLPRGSIPPDDLQQLTGNPSQTDIQRRKQREEKARAKEERRLRKAALSQQKKEAREKAAAAAAVRNKVFAIVELAEGVFLHLGMLDILAGVIQTNKHWNTIVEKSIRLQQHLFFQPIGIAPLHFSTKKDCWEAPGIPGKHMVYEHPLLTMLHKLALKSSETQARAREEMMGPEVAVGAAEEYAKALYKALKCPTASWTRALVCQPPIKNIYCLCEPPIKDLYCLTNHESYRNDQNENGVTLAGIIPTAVSEKRTEIDFWKPEKKLRGYNNMAYYKGYHQLETLLEAQKNKKS